MFGSTAYVHFPKDSRKTPDSKTRKCILVGYGSVNQILFSRNVKFNEQEATTEATPDPETGKSTPEPTKLDIVLHEESKTDEESEERITHPRRSSRQRKPVDYYGYEKERVNLTIHQDPTSFKEAMSSPEKDQWNRVMERKMESLNTNKVWTLTTLPPGKEAVG